MIGEHFIDICLRCCVTIGHEHKRAKELFSNMHRILKWYKDETPKDKIPVEFANKLELTYNLSGHRLSLKRYDSEAMLSRLSTGSFHSFVPILESYIKEGYADEEDFEDLFHIILNKRKACEVLKGKNRVQRLFNDIDSGNFVDDEEIIKRWEDCLKSSHDVYIKMKKSEAIGKAESLDVLNDDLGSVLDNLRKSVDTDSTLKTGYKYLEHVLPCQGFEDRRLYLIGGTSGVGKSTKLINLISNAVFYNLIDDPKDELTYLYITAENLIDESFVRFYCCLTGVYYNEFISKINQLNDIVKKVGDIDKNIEIMRKFKEKLLDTIKHKLKEMNVNVIFKYVQPKRTTCAEIEAIIDEVACQYNLRATFIDYLDLITTGSQEELRHELGLIAREFKNFAIAYSMPVITATQLNRSGYSPDSQPTLIQMSESMEKVNNSDFVLFLQEGKGKRITYKAPDGSGTKIVKPIRASILKNRSGVEGDTYMCEMELFKNNVSTFNFRIKEMPKVKMMADDLDDEPSSIKYE